MDTQTSVSITSAPFTSRPHPRSVSRSCRFEQRTLHLHSAPARGNTSQARRPQSAFPPRNKDHQGVAIFVLAGVAHIDQLHALYRQVLPDRHRSASISRGSGPLIGQTVPTGTPAYFAGSSRSWPIRGTRCPSVPSAQHAAVSAMYSLLAADLGAGRFRYVVPMFRVVGATSKAQRPRTGLFKDQKHLLLQRVHENPFFLLLSSQLCRQVKQVQDFLFPYSLLMLKNAFIF